MSEKIIIYLSNSLAEINWIIINSKTQEILNHGVWLEQLSNLTIAKDIIVLVPAEDVLLTTVTLPKMNRTRLLRALPFALEEKLISDIETLHFAVGIQQPDGPIPVAIVSQDKMQNWSAQLQAVNVIPSMMMPISLALPWKKDHWTIYTNEMVITRTAEFAGFGCEINNFANYLSLALAQYADKPKQIDIHHYSSLAHHLLSIEKINVKEENHSAEHFLSHLVIDSSSSLNLLQNKYMVKQSTSSQLRKIWQFAAYLAVAWIVLLFFYPAVSFFILKFRLNDIDNQIAQIYKNNFSSVQIIAPKLRMEEKLQQLNAGLNKDRFLLLLAQVSKAFTAAIRIRRLDFQNNQLTLDINADDSEALTHFTDFLNQQGLTVTQQNVVFADNSKINALIIVE